MSILVDPRIWVEHTALGKVHVEAERIYRLAADRTTGPGYVVSFQLMDAVADSVIPVTGGLDARDSTRVDCSPYEAYGFDVEADLPVEITLESAGSTPTSCSSRRPGNSFPARMPAMTGREFESGSFSRREGAGSSSSTASEPGSRAPTGWSSGRDRGDRSRRPGRGRACREGRRRP